MRYWTAPAYPLGLRLARIGAPFWRPGRPSVSGGSAHAPREAYGGNLGPSPAGKPLSRSDLGLVRPVRQVEILGLVRQVEILGLVRQVEILEQKGAN